MTVVYSTMWWKDFFFPKQCLNHPVLIWTEETWTIFFLRGKESKQMVFFPHFVPFFFLMTQNWVTFQTGGTKRSKRWLKELYIDEIVTFEATLDLVFSSMCTDDTCMQVYKAIFFCIKKKSPVYTPLNYTHIHIHTHYSKCWRAQTYFDL